MDNERRLKLKTSQIVRSVAKETQQKESANKKSNDFKNKFYSAISEATVLPKNSQSEFAEDDRRWAETKLGGDSPTGKPQIYINDAKFLKSNAGSNYRKDMLIGEGLHLIKKIDPDRAEKLYNTAVKDPSTLRWLEDSYMREKESGEKRPFADWVKNSRLDQIIGGYLLGGENSSIPTMRNWPTEKLPYGKAFKAEIEKLKKDLDI